MKKFLNNLIISSLLSFTIGSCVFATHNVSRYLPFLEQPEMYRTKKKSHLLADIFYSSAATAFKRSGGNAGMLELGGIYDLKNVITSLQAVQPTANPVSELMIEGFRDKCIVFGVEGKIRAFGLQLNYEQSLGFLNLALGATLPIMTVHTSSRYKFKPEDSDQMFQRQFLTTNEKRQHELVVDQLRRLTHQKIGFQGNIWKKGGLGDLDLHLRWSYERDYALAMKNIYLALQGGVIVPTAEVSDRCIPASISFGSNGHWGLYTDLMMDLELKHNLRFGMLLGFVHQFDHTRKVRIAIENEPMIFSALVGNLKTKPGFTFKLSPWLTIENMTDGLHFQARYTYLRHEDDTFFDARCDQTIKSFLQRDECPRERHEGLTRWRSHHFTFQLIYDTKIARQHVSFDPVFFLRYDMPMSSRGVAKTHTFSLGAQLQF